MKEMAMHKISCGTSDCYIFFIWTTKKASGANNLGNIGLVEYGY